MSLINMKTILLLFVLLAPFAVIHAVEKEEVKQPDFVQAKTHIFPIKSYRVIDGDTVEVLLDLQFGLTMKTSILVNGINTPEVRGDKEKRAGLAVKSLVEQWLKSQDKLYCKVIEADKFGGRYVGNIITPSDYTLGEYLLDNELAQEYDGKTKKKEFTKKELDFIEETAYDLFFEELEK